MARIVKEMSALEVKRLTKAGAYPVGGVPGLMLQVKDSGSRSWILRVTVGDARRWIGLGGFPAVGLSEARDKAREARGHIENGEDPVAKRKKAKAALKQAQAKPTFEKCAEDFIGMKKVEWSNPKHSKQWAATLIKYAYPIIGDKLVDEVTKADVLAILTPIWTSKTETANRVRGRIEMVLDYAVAKELRPEGLNPAQLRGNLDKLLPLVSKVKTVTHHAALPYKDIGSFMEKLRSQEGMGAKALEFAILTAARSGEVRHATWDEIDLTAKTWTIPGERMKAGKEHCVPLSSAAVKLLKATKKTESPLVFPSVRLCALSDMTLAASLHRITSGMTVHGFRSTFRDWAAECTNTPSEVVEMALAHTIKNKVEAAYRRGDLFQKRAALMQTWATFCSKPSSAATVTRLEIVNG